MSAPQPEDTATRIRTLPRPGLSLVPQQRSASDRPWEPEPIDRQVRARPLLVPVSEAATPEAVTPEPEPAAPRRGVRLLLWLIPALVLLLLTGIVGGYLLMQDAGAAPGPVSDPGPAVSDAAAVRDVAEAYLQGATARDESEVLAVTCPWVAVSLQSAPLGADYRISGPVQIDGDLARVTAVRSGAGARSTFILPLENRDGGWCVSR